MRYETELGEMDGEVAARIDRPPRTKARSLGAAILLVAIEDYRSLDAFEHQSAERFLYPQTCAWQERYDWVVALTEGLNPAWLREALDRLKIEWDQQRSIHMSRQSRRALQSSLQLDRRNRTNEERRAKRSHPDGLVVPAEPMRSSHLSLQPAREASGAGPGDVAAVL
jgi:hypothetical protein